MNLERARDALLADRDTTRARLAALAGELQEVVTAATGSNIDDEHDPEGATVAFEREQLKALHDHAQRRLEEIDRALGRMAHGDYGVCERCGAPIGDERLAARPSALQCVACAAGPGPR